MAKSPSANDARASRYSRSTWNGAVSLAIGPRLHHDGLSWTNVRATTRVLSSVPIATATNNAHAPRLIQSDDDSHIPIASAGTPMVQLMNTIACSVRSRIACGDGGGTL